jgi:hypothetical protein
VPAAAARVLAALAGASLYIYLVHWQVYPHLEHHIPWLATVLSLLAGLVLWQTVERVTPVVVRLARTAASHLRSRRRAREAWVPREWGTIAGG